MCIRDSASAGATSQSFAGAPLKHSQPNLIGSHNLHEADVGALGKASVPLQQRPQMRHWRLIHIIHQQHRMWIPHRHDPHFEFQAISGNRITEGAGGGEEGNIGRLQPGLAHINCYSSVRLEVQPQQPGGGDHSQIVFLRQTMVTDKAGEAAGEMCIRDSLYYSFALNFASSCVG